MPIFGGMLLFASAKAILGITHRSKPGISIVGNVAGEKSQQPLYENILPKTLLSGRRGK